jgi:hypothetical protein
MEDDRRATTAVAWRAMDKPRFYIYRTDTDEGPRDYVSLLSLEQVEAQGGLAPEAVVGVLTRRAEEDEAITPAAFMRNRAFLDFMHDVVARRAPRLPGFVAQAYRLREGWLPIVDRRSPSPEGPVPPQDVVGAFEVKGGAVIPGSYRRSPDHLILTEEGFFDLGPELMPCLLAELGELGTTRGDAPEPG